MNLFVVIPVHKHKILKRGRWIRVCMWLTNFALFFTTC